MKQRHKHFDVIIAWANGEEIEVDYEDGWGWQGAGEGPSFSTNHKYRIKPKTMSQEGWINIYSTDRWAFIYKSKEEADFAESASERIDCIRIKWKEKI